MNVLAFIPARAGSKGIPGKNTRVFAGRPLYKWTVDAAVEAIREVSHILVSTDDPVILRDCPYAVERPSDLCGDDARIEDAILYHLDGMTRKPDLIALLQPTSPLRTSQDIESAILHLQQAGADSLLSGVFVHQPFYWRRDQSLSWLRPYDTRPNRQDLREVLLENGAIYVFRTEGFLRCGDRLFGKIAAYGMGPEHRYEIDDETDWNICEALMLRRLVAVQRDT